MKVIDGAAVERVSSNKFLGLHISEDLSGPTAPHLWPRRLKHASTFSVAASLCGMEATDSCCKTLQRVVNAATRIIGALLPSLTHIFHTRKAISIAGDASHLSHSLSSLFPSGKRSWSLQAHSTKLSDSFFHQVVRLLNPAHCPLTPTLDTICSTLCTAATYLGERDTPFQFFCMP